MANDDIIAALQAERDQILQRIAAIDIAIEALGTGGALPVPGYGRRPQVGEDKLDKIREYLRKHSTAKSPWVRQADITHATKLNSGSISSGLNLLKQRGEVEEGPKQDRAKTWRLTA